MKKSFQETCWSGDEKTSVNARRFTNLFLIYYHDYVHQCCAIQSSFWVTEGGGRTAQVAVIGTTEAEQGDDTERKLSRGYSRFIVGRLYKQSNTLANYWFQLPPNCREL